MKRSVPPPLLLLCHSCPSCPSVANLTIACLLMGVYCSFSFNVFLIYLSFYYYNTRYVLFPICSSFLPFLGFWDFLKKLHSVLTINLDVTYYLGYFKYNNDILTIFPDNERTLEHYLSSSHICYCYRVFQIHTHIYIYIYPHTPIRHQFLVLYSQHSFTFILSFSFFLSFLSFCLS